MGDIYQRGKHRDLYISFSFTNTDEMQKMKITKPGIKFHKVTDEYKAQEAQRRAQKQQLKETNNTKSEKKSIFKRLFSKKKDGD